VFFHSIDFVLSRETARDCYRYNPYHPKVKFDNGKKKKSRQSRKCQFFSKFQRMLILKDIVFEHHVKMLRFYETACAEAQQEAYWGDDFDNDGPAIDTADATNEVVEDDTF
jgi:hypothetical protein